METSESTIELKDALQAIPYGAVAFVGGFLFASMVIASEVENPTLELFPFVAAFYGLHNVTISSGAASTNFFQSISGQSSILGFLWLLQPAYLMGMGAIFAERGPGRLYGDEPLDGAKAGALIATGYGLLAILGALFLTDEGFSLNLVETVIFMGIVFPVLFGGFGGYQTRT